MTNSLHLHLQSDWCDCLFFGVLFQYGSWEDNATRMSAVGLSRFLPCLLVLSRLRILLHLFFKCKKVFRSILLSFVFLNFLSENNAQNWSTKNYGTAVYHISVPSGFLHWRHILQCCKCVGSM